MSINKVILIGNVTKDPEIRQTKDGKEIASFSLATNERWKDKNGEKKEKVEFHNISAFGGVVNVIKNYVKKGSKLYIEGALETQKYEKNGQDVYTTKVVLKAFNSTLQLLDSKESRILDSHNEAKGNGYQSQDDFDQIPY